MLKIHKAITISIREPILIKQCLLRCINYSARIKLLQTQTLLRAVVTVQGKILLKLIVANKLRVNPCLKLYVKILNKLNLKLFKINRINLREQFSNKKDTQQLI